MKTVTATNARKNLFDLIALAGKPGAIVAIQHRDLPSVVMMSAEEFDGWMETMEIMSDPEAMKAIREAEKDNDFVDWDTVKKDLNL